MKFVCGVVENDNKISCIVGGGLFFFTKPLECMCFSTKPFGGHINISTAKNPNLPSLAVNYEWSLIAVYCLF